MNIMKERHGYEETTHNFLGQEKSLHFILRARGVSEGGK